jgi:hypothetical protein
MHAALLGAAILIGSPGASGAEPQTTVSAVPLPGGLRAALAAVGDRTPPDRAHFLAEFIRRTYDRPVDAKRDPRGVALRSLVAELTAAAAQSDPSETLPLPLSDRIWIDAVFGGRATPQTLVSAILQSRSAALLYCGLLWLDDGTRAWIAGEPALISELASGHAAAFLAAAPGLRVTAAGVQVPGGALAAPAWRVLVGRSPEEPAEFVRALVASDEGRLAHFFGTIGQLTPHQVRVALNLALPDVPDRVDAVRRLHSVFVRLSDGYSPEQHAFTRPALDPALLVAELEADESGRPLLPGSRGLWMAAFAGGDDNRAGPPPDVSRATPEWATPADFPWLCELVFNNAPLERRRRYMMVLFASRRLARDQAAAARDAVVTIRAAGAYPALTAALERAGVTDIATFAGAARQAAALSTIEDGERAARAIAQFQGALALVTRAAVRRSLAAGSASTLVASLAAVPVSNRGEYEGRLVSWLSGWMAAEAAARGPAVRAAALPAGSAEEAFIGSAGPVERLVLRVLAGPEAVEPRVLEWEGTRYRLDLTAAEATRLARAFGEAPGSFLSSAVRVVGIADALADARLTREGLQKQAQELAGVPAARLSSCCSGAAAALTRAADAGNLHAAPGLASALRLLADDLLARGLMEMAYAAALGPRDGVSLSAADAAGRHDFGFGSGLGRGAPWRLPWPGTDIEGRWRVDGSLLGLDVRLADFSLVRLSSGFPPRRPTLDEVDRRVLIEAVALIEPASLSDADRDTITAAIRRGRARLDAAHTPLDALTIAEDVRLSEPRRTLLSWTLMHDPGRVAAFLSPSELFWLGLGDVRMEALQAWGAPAGPRLGCHCLQFVHRRPWEIVAGRRNVGMMASAFPDLNLRLAELLSELRLPAALLGPVLTSATLDFVTAVISRDPDDRRGLVEFVQALRSEHLEQYLALLTTGGPLVPIGTAEAKAQDHPRPPPRVPEAIAR